LETGEVGYLYPAKFKNLDGAMIMEKFKNTKAIIVDFRCYPSDFMPFAFVGRYYVPDAVQHVTFSYAVGELPGYFVDMPQSLGVPNSDYYKGKVIVLVNEQTQSSAEYQTMAFQAIPDCVVIGSQTAGADGNVVSSPLPRNIKTLFSGLGVFYPNGTNTQRMGIRIDHYVTPTVEGIRSGRDEVLEQAIRIAKINKRNPKIFKSREN
jgi:C-terminal processing protease CtpA/Prc